MNLSIFSSLKFNSDFIQYCLNFKHNLNISKLSFLPIICFSLKKELGNLHIHPRIYFFFYINKNLKAVTCTASIIPEWPFTAWCRCRMMSETFCSWSGSLLELNEPIRSLITAPAIRIIFKVYHIWSYCLLWLKPLNLSTCNTYTKILCWFLQKYLLYAIYNT